MLQGRAHERQQGCYSRSVPPMLQVKRYVDATTMKVVSCAYLANPERSTQLLLYCWYCCYNLMPSNAQTLPTECSSLNKANLAGHKPLRKFATISKLSDAQSAVTTQFV
jgi:hypothetical protein